MSPSDSTKYENFLKKTVQSPDKHARFVNTLSMLEYMGARKIFKSQRAEDISISLLSHAADEIRHAKLLKRAALEMSQGRLDSYQEGHLLCGSNARKYFQAVDHLAESEKMELTSVQKYALTTLLVEKRVLQLYPVYHAILSGDRLLSVSAPQVVIGAILKDEERHMDHVSHRLFEDAHISKKHIERLLLREDAAFQDLAQAWSQ